MNADSPIDAETWYHVAVTLTEMGDEATAELYLDGELLNAVDWSTTETGYLNGSTTAGNPIDRDRITMPFRIGGNGSEIRFFNGKIDEVRIYEGVLTKEEIVEAMAEGLPSSVTPNKNEQSFVYPTSGDGNFYINSISTVNSYQVFDMNGRLLINVQNSSNKTLNLENLTSGAYFIKLKNSSESVVQKILIK